MAAQPPAERNKGKVEIRKALGTWNKSDWSAAQENLCRESSKVC